MTVRGRGGLPPRQTPYRPGSAAVAPGSKQITKTRELIIGPNGGLFLYAGQPAAGNPPVLWSVAPGTSQDPYGNALPGGTNVFGAGNPTGAGTFIDESGDVTLTGAGGSQLSMMPAAALPFSLTSVFSGIMQTLISLGSGDSNQAQAGVLAGVTVGTGTAAKMGTLISSPYGASSGMGMLLQAENDGGTDTPSALIGTVSTQGGTLTFTPAAAVYPSALVLYTGGGTVNVVTKNSGSGTIPIPANAAATAVGQCWGIAGSGGSPGGVAVFGGGGGGGGAYSAEPALAITPGGTVAFSIAAAVGSDTTLTGSAVTVTAHSGTNGGDGSTGNPGTGGPTSGNTVSFAGGNGGRGFGSGGGGGGGSSAGPAGAGAVGQNGRAHAGGTGASGGTGTGRGGAGGGPGNNGSPGSAPGGGSGGGGWKSTTGPAGAAARATLTFNAGTFSVLAAIANAAFTDQFGNSILAGNHYTGPDGNLYSVGKTVAEASSGTTINSLSNIPIAGTARQVVAGTYLIRGQVHGTNGAVAATQAVSITFPATSNFNCEVDIRSATANSYKAFGEITGGGGRVGTAALAANEVFIATYSGIATFTASGTVQLGGSCVTAAADTWIANNTSFLALEPL